MEYRREIDGLRAVAVLPVLLFHGGFSLFSGGFVGVDVFFVISGYLITTIIVTEIAANQFTLVNFYERRARRILPALLFVVLSCYPFAWAWLTAEEYKYFSQSVLAVITFTSNIFFWKTSGYFESASELKPLLHTWSLAVEEQYYIIFPLLLIALHRYWRNRVKAVIAGLGLFSLILAQWGSVHNTDATFYLLLTRGWELLIGAGVAIYLSKTNISFSKRAIPELASIIGLCAILSSALLFDRNTPFPSIYALVPTVGCALIILFCDNRTIIGRFLGSRYMVGMGLISYSTYLWHQPILAFARIRLIDPIDSKITLLLLLGSVVLAYFTWLWIETPFRKKVTCSRGKLLRYALSFAGIALLAGGSGVASSGFPDRFPISNAISPTRSDALQQVNSCFLVSKKLSAFDEDYCLSTAKNKKYRILLLGDSHAASLYPGLSNYLSRFPEVSLSMLTAAYCLPLVENFTNHALVYGNSRCEAINKRIRAIIEREQFDMVLVSSLITEWAFNPQSDYSYPDYYREYVDQIKNINTIAKVSVIGPLINWNGALPSIIHKEIIDNSIARATDLPQYSRAGIVQRVFAANEQLQKDLTANGIDYISITNSLCQEAACMRYIKNSKDIKLLSFDYGHLGLEGSQYVADEIIGPAIVNKMKPKVRMDQHK